VDPSLVDASLLLPDVGLALSSSPAVEAEVTSSSFPLEASLGVMLLVGNGLPDPGGSPHASIANRGTNTTRIDAFTLGCAGVAGQRGAASHDA
jgi:hypothetical protein